MSFFIRRVRRGVQVFLDLKERIADDLKPDFLLIDSRTGITEMGGVATTLLADKVITLVLPTAENLDGARAVLRSLRRSKRESGAGDLEVMVALSRIPQMTETDGDRDWTERIRLVLNEEADDLKDTLSISEVFVLHSEVALEIHEALRVGSGISPDESILLRDYLRLFANIVPRELIEPKFGKLISQAKEKIWDDPEAALKEVEELAESFGHPDNYRELLRFYDVRNVRGTSVLKRAQRLWELTRDSKDDALWQVLLREFDIEQRWRRQPGWAPNLDFVEAVWRDAGKRNPEFAKTLAQAYNLLDRESRGADVLLEVLDAFEPTGDIVLRCTFLLDAASRAAESDRLIRDLKPKLSADPKFVEAWARHVLRNTSKDALAEILEPPARDMLGTIRPSIAAELLFKAGLIQEAAPYAEKALRDTREREGPPTTEREMVTLAEIFHTLGRFEEFERLARGRLPSRMVDELRERNEQRRRHGQLAFLPPK